MTNQERAAIVNLIREYVRATADIQALLSILALEQREHRVTEDWQADLEAMRQSPEYAARIAASEPGIAEIDQALAEDVQQEENNLMELIARLPHHLA